MPFFLLWCAKYAKAGLAPYSQYTAFDLGLKDILVVSHIQKKKKLSSISQLITNYPSLCEFSSTNFNDKKTTTILTRGTRTWDVYSLSHLINAHFSTRFQMANKHTWHVQLGHPSMCLV